MRRIVFSVMIALLLFVCPVALHAAATDEFGPAGFGQNSHEGLGGETRTMDDVARGVSDIEPSAGPSKTIKTDTEKELEREYGVDVEQTIIDRGDSETLTRDRMGDGDVGLFYEHKKDGRVQDDQDAIGIELRLLEFD